MMKYNKSIYIFTLNNLKKEGGAVLRIKGLISLLSKSYDVKLLSNSATAGDEVNSIYLSCHFSKREKQTFQLLITFLPVELIYLLFKKKLSKLERLVRELNIRSEDELIFCEYLDNSIGYYLKKRRIIDHYVNDHHGVATIEFSQAQKNVVSRLKLWVAKIHDEHVLSFSDKHIFASKRMKEYYMENFTSYKNKDIRILPYYFSSKSYKEDIDQCYINDFMLKIGFSSFSKLILFVGYFKPLGGVKDLVLAFSELSPIKENLCLCLVGEGPEYESVNNLILELGLENNIVMPGRIDYKYLASLQSISDVVVCPDKYNEYSDMIVHLKYYHSLLSNKPVVCGDFSSVEELNSSLRLSIPFKPSDVDSLSRALKLALYEDFPLVQNTREYVLDNFSYENVSLSCEII
ncbi:glycosyltransferase [Vibrio splendidus]